jgi:hypothetical protein
MRSLNDQLLEAELMNSSPDYVYAWIRRRGECSDDGAWEGDDALEVSLLNRHSPIIDLGLARFGRCDEVVHRLFSGDVCSPKEASADTGRSTWAGQSSRKAVRLAALSNCIRHYKTIYSDRISEILFEIPRLSEDLEPMRDFVESAEADEVYTLFQNPSVGQKVLAKLYEKARPFDNLTEERWRALILCTIGNRSLDYCLGMDAWEALMYDRMVCNAWRLANSVPTTTEWAEVLGLLLNSTFQRVMISSAEMLAMIPRWRVGTNEWDEGPQDASYCKDGYLDHYGTLRLLLAREPLVFGFRDHEDVALRCAFYKFAPLSTVDMREAYAKEPRLFLNYALDNESIWRSNKTRDTLAELCLLEYKQDEDRSLGFPNAFRAREEAWDKEHPEWIWGKEHSEWFEEVPAIRSDKFKQAQRLQTNYEGLADLQKAVLAQRAQLSTLLWLGFIILALLLFSRV